MSESTNMQTTNIKYNLGNGVWVEIEAENPADAVRQLSQWQDALGERECGKCGSKDIRFSQFETREGKEMFVMNCHAKGCRASITLAQVREGGRLFLSRKNRDGQELPQRGWTVYNPNGSR